MLIKKIYLFFLLALILVPCKSQKTDIVYSSETLKIVSISENSFVHVSYLNTNDFGKVACNGLVYMKNHEAIVFDTPTDSEVSQELLNWLVDNKKSIVKAVVVNHFHIDCLGGLQAFHDSEIPSYANSETIELAKNDGAVIPLLGFDIKNELEIGGKKIINRHFGAAHTKDNIVSYIPDEKMIFGGCMIKSLNASKGNLEDANIEEWSNTIQKIKDEYPNLKTVVPGHGAHGNTELLDYTIELFKAN